MKRLLTPMLLLVCASLLTCGCTNVGALVVTGLRADVTGIKRAPDGSAMVSWNMVNTNVIPYVLSRVESRLYLDGKAVGTLLDTEPLGIPANDQVAKTTRLSGMNAAGRKLLAEAASRGELKYRIDSNLVIQIYGDSHEKGELTNQGSVKVIGP